MEGGLRDRMVWTSMFNMVVESLDLLGWLDDPVAAALDHAQVQVRMTPWPEGQPIPPNTVVIMPEDIDYLGLETGSNAEIRNRVFLIDIYAEDHIVGRHLSGDISAILRGRMPSIGRDRAVLDVYDYTQATPPVVAVCDIENVRDERAHSTTHPWEQCWYSVMCVIEDEGWD